jgi:hypothetical protein
LATVAANAEVLRLGYKSSSQRGDLDCSGACAKHRIRKDRPVGRGERFMKPSRLPYRHIPASFQRWLRLNQIS